MAAFGLSILLVGLAAATQSGFAFVGALVLAGVLAYFLWK